GSHGLPLRAPQSIRPRTHPWLYPLLSWTGPRLNPTPLPAESPALAGITHERRSGARAGGLLGRLAQELDEPAHRRRERRLPPMDDPHGPDQVGNRQRDGAQRPDPDFLLDGVPGQDRHAGRNHNRLLDRLDVVELHDRVDLDVVLAQRAVDRLADREPRVEGDERLAI